MGKKTLYLFIFYSFLASAVNYLSYPSLARLLPSDQYINITVSLSLLTQIGTFMSALTAVTIGLSKQKDDNQGIMIDKLQSSLLQIFSILGISFLFISPVLMNIIGTPKEYALPITLMLIVSVPITIMSGYLNGKQQMKRLGLVALLTSLFQFSAGVISAALIHNGFITMLLMGLAQIFAIGLIYIIFRDPNLPVVGRDSLKLQKYSKPLRKILFYIILAAISVMILNLLQIIDLIIIKNLKGDLAKFYTDIYVISRIVFFMGVIFIWPYLGEISMRSSRVSNMAFSKFITITLALGMLSIIILNYFGELFAYILFGETYTDFPLHDVLALSVLYKLFFLIISCASLFFIVHRSNKVLYLTAGTILIIGLAIYIAEDNNMLSILISLTSASFILAVIASAMVFRHHLVTSPSQT